VSGLKALDPNRPIREADIDGLEEHVRFVPTATFRGAVKQAHEIAGVVA
jgi:hypothetical protein